MLIKATFGIGAPLTAAPATRVAVCIAGAVSTFAHPRVIHDYQVQLLQNHWDVFASFSMPGSPALFSVGENSDQSALLTLSNLSRVHDALGRVGMFESVLTDRHSVPAINCSIPSLRPGLGPEAYALEQCLVLIERAEHRLQATYSHVVHVRPDHL